MKKIDDSAELADFFYVHKDELAEIYLKKIKKSDCYVHRYNKAYIVATNVLEQYKKETTECQKNNIAKMIMYKMEE